ncbi:MAG TPA: sulfur carrier protein ThiS [Candidatus Omnitrophota bacterium]|mgnify:CR=1 FL=1|nr:sulfur carrier protein ThiS [Candidatus Omnitrophota bacterium]HPN56460.1 sulfur carrier protein ThiS [Candidatus Omnitrophota bacterium]
MKISINGKTHALTGPQPLSRVIQGLCKNNPYVIVELNGDIIHKDLWQSVQLCEGDRIELVSFVGGG